MKQAWDDKDFKSHTLFHNYKALSVNLRCPGGLGKATVTSPKFSPCFIPHQAASHHSSHAQCDIGMIGGLRCGWRHLDVKTNQHFPPLSRKAITWEWKNIGFSRKLQWFFNPVRQSLQTDLIWNFTIVVLPFLQQFLFFEKLTVFNQAFESDEWR